jgi:hypothetical protein
MIYRDEFWQRLVNYKKKELEVAFLGDEMFYYDENDQLVGMNGRWVKRIKKVQGKMTRTMIRTRNLLT